MAGIREDVSKSGPGWSSALKWYAKAVRELMTRPPNDRTSWRYLAGIHGFNKNTWLGAGVIDGGDPLPPTAEWNGRMWSQCQHQGWYFLPWHRGYLHAFEAIVGAAVKELGGPSDWALPYWNYFSSDPSAYQMHAAFTDPQMPDGSDNALALPPRNSTELDLTQIDLDAMQFHRYTSAAGTLGFGGGMTAFSHFGGLTGALESNPHNTVHVMIGGFMMDPDLAGLDPIFWLHHCNIDRLWAAWLTQDDNIMEGRNAWLNGPARKFEMPGSDGKLHTFTPADTMPGGPLAPAYDDLENGTGLPAIPAGVDEILSGEAPMPAKTSTEPPPPATLVGASAGKVNIGGSPATAEVKLEEAAAEIAGDPTEQRIFLNLENVRGEAPSATLILRIGAPAAGAVPASESSYVKSVALFGLAKASASDGEHGGNGINVAVDITDIAKKLAQEAGVPVDKLEVHIEQASVAPGQPAVTVERISIYKQPVE